MRRLALATLCALLPVGLLAADTTLVRAVEARSKPIGGDVPALPIEQAPDGEVVPITDPARLVAMGFPADARNVYMHASVFSGVKPSEAQGTVTPQFGSGPNSNYTSIAARSFVGRQNTAALTWQYSGGVVGCCENLSRTGTEEFADAEILLPPGVAIQSVRYWAVDTNAVDDLFFSIIQNCLPGFGGGPATQTVIAQGQTVDATGFQGGLLAGGPATVNMRDCTYLARVRFPVANSLTFQKLRVEWRRQVTPQPAVATFTDVPVTHFFARWIEAIAAAGITAGCGGGMYCPDAPVTRAQMAVFLSVALGLAAQ